MADDSLSSTTTMHVMQRLSQLESGVVTVESLTRIRDCQKKLFGMLGKVEDDHELNSVTQLLTNGAEEMFAEVLTGFVQSVVTPGPAGSSGSVAGENGMIFAPGQAAQIIRMDGNHDEVIGPNRRQPHPKAFGDFVRSDQPSAKKGYGHPRKNAKLTAEDIACIKAWKTRHQTSRFNWALVLEENPQLKERFTPAQCSLAYHSYQQYWRGRNAK